MTPPILDSEKNVPPPHKKKETPPPHKKWHVPNRPCHGFRRHFGGKAKSRGDSHADMTEMSTKFSKTTLKVTNMGVAAAYFDP